MGSSDSKLDLSEYDITKIADLGKFLFIGPTIDAALWQYLHLKRHLPKVVVLAPPKYEERYRQIVPDVFIHTSYHTDISGNIIKAQLQKDNSPVMLIIEHDSEKLPVDRLYKHDRNFRQLLDYSDRLKLCLIIVMRDEPVYIKLRPITRQYEDDDDNDNVHPSFDYVFVSRKLLSEEKKVVEEEVDENDDDEKEEEKEEETEIDAAYNNQVYKYYFKRYLKEDKDTFIDTITYYTTKNHVLLLHHDQELFYYLPQLPSEPFVIASQLWTPLQSLSLQTNAPSNTTTSGNPSPLI